MYAVFGVLNGSGDIFSFSEKVLIGGEYVNVSEKVSENFDEHWVAFLWLDDNRSEYDDLTLEIRKL